MTDMKRFLCYSLYAWGIPFVIVGISAFIHFLPDHVVHESISRPRYGQSSCWLAGSYYEYFESHLKKEVRGFKIYMALTVCVRSYQDSFVSPLGCVNILKFALLISVPLRNK